MLFFSYAYPVFEQRTGKGIYTLFVLDSYRKSGTQTHRTSGNHEIDSYAEDRLSCLNVCSMVTSSLFGVGNMSSQPK